MSSGERLLVAVHPFFAPLVDHAGAIYHDHVLDANAEAPEVTSRRQRRRTRTAEDDMDVLDPREVPGHPLTVRDGPTSLELGAALTEMFRHEKVAALGIASTPANERDPDGLSLAAAYNLVKGALGGVTLRDGR